MDATQAHPDTLVLEFKEDRPLTEVSLSLAPSHQRLPGRMSPFCSPKQRMHDYEKLETHNWNA